MAKFSKNGNLSGALGNLVFVSRGACQYVRTKPAKVKQSANTKKAGQVFGAVSRKDKEFRRMVMACFDPFRDERYAARHRAAFGRSCSTDQADDGASLVFDRPEALQNFAFVKDMPWEKLTRIYPDPAIDAHHVLSLELPAHRIGENLMLPQSVSKAKVSYQVFAANPDQDPVQIRELATVELTATRQSPGTPQTITCDLPDSPCWVILLGSIEFFGEQPRLQAKKTGTSAYLWAKALQEELRL